LKLLAKFNLIFIVLFGAGLAIAGRLAYGYLNDNARAQVLQQAELMMESAGSTRQYTSSEVKPLLQRLPSQNVFLPQTVPAYAATVSFNFLRRKYPEYTYKEAALNPTNLRDRAVEWEADIINYFRNHSGATEVVGDRQTPLGASLYLAHPIAADPPCLDCHDTPAGAPRSIIRTYGRDNGFGWKPNEIIGAQIVSVPMAVPVRMANRAFRELLMYLAAMFVVTLLIADAALLFIVIRPIRRLADRADRISRGEMDLPELPVRGKDEIANATASFNRMYVSLAKAFRLLGGTSTVA
jgi:protein-histidine pros-kinase